jgi:hypothetical protein
MMTARRFGRYIGFLALAASTLSTVGAPSPAIAACSWTTVSSPKVGRSWELSAVAAVSPADVWAVGAANIRYSWRPLTEHWNGQSWSRYPVPSTGDGDDDFLNNVAAVASNDVWAVGDILDQSTLRSSSLIEHWNGVAWSRIASPNLPGGSELFGVATIPGTSRLWAVGARALESGTPQTLIQLWNGTAWNVIPSPNPPTGMSFLSDVGASSATDAWAVGSTLDQNVGAPLLFHWNGTTWSIVSSPPNGFADEAISVLTGSDAYAAGGTIDHWNGAEWSVQIDPPFSLDDISVESPTEGWVVGTQGGGANPLQTAGMHWDGLTWTEIPPVNIGTDENNSLNGVAEVPGSSRVWAVGSHGPPRRHKALIERYC